MAAPLSERLPRAATLPLDGRAVFLRLDLNAPFADDGSILSDARLRAAVPAIEEALAMGARLAIASHLGQPEKPDKRFSLLPVMERLSALIDRDIVFCPELTGDAVRSCIGRLAPGEAMALENLRFDAGEAANAPAFVRGLAAPFSVYLSDAFATLHRRHASIVGLPQAIGLAGIGPLIAHETTALDAFLQAPKRGTVAIVGGAKVADKIGLLRALVERADVVMVGGAMAHPFLAARGIRLGRSLLEPAALPLARSVLNKAREKHCRILLPQDHVAAASFSADSAPVMTPDANVPDGMMALDIGEATRALYAEIARRAQAVFWNGPLGVANWPAFAGGSRAVAHAVASNPFLSIVGGGDTLALLEAECVIEKVRHASTGGGASLAYVEHGTLVGLEAIARVPHSS